MNRLKCIVFGVKSMIFICYILCNTVLAMERSKKIVICHDVENNNALRNEVLSYKSNFFDIYVKCESDDFLTLKGILDDCKDDLNNITIGLLRFFYTHSECVRDLLYIADMNFEIGVKHIRSFCDYYYLACLVEALNRNMCVVKINDGIFREIDEALSLNSLPLLKKIILKRIKAIFYNGCIGFINADYRRNKSNYEKKVSELEKSIDIDVEKYFKDLGCLNNIASRINSVDLADFYVDFITQVLKGYIDKDIDYERAEKIFKELFLDEIVLNIKSVEKIYKKISCVSGFKEYQIITECNNSIENYTLDECAILSKPVNKFYELFFKYLAKDCKLSNIKNRKLYYIVDKKENIEKIRNKSPIEITYNIPKVNDGIGRAVKVFSDVFFDRYGDNFYVLDSKGLVSNLESNTIKLLVSKERAKVSLFIKGNANIIDLSEMFCECENLREVSGLGNIVNNEVTDMNNMTDGCVSLSSLSGISDLGPSNDHDMSKMFYGCSSLLSLPDIAELNTSKVSDMSHMFEGCSSLTELINIYFGWNTSEVTNMSCMFKGCRLLKKLNISNWKTSKVKDMSYMFSGCSLLESLIISNWKTSEVVDMRFMFKDCRSLKSLSGISKWNTSKVTNMSYMFSGCSKLKSLSNISKWDTSNVTDMSYMFYGCDKLSPLPNIFNWDISSLETFINIFDRFKENDYCREIDEINRKFKEACDKNEKK